MRSRRRRRGAHLSERTRLALQVRQSVIRVASRVRGRAACGAWAGQPVGSGHAGVLHTAPAPVRLYGDDGAGRACGRNLGFPLARKDWRDLCAQRS